jgi:hypothetical protein
VARSGESWAACSLSGCVDMAGAGDKPDWFGETVTVGANVDAMLKNGEWLKGEVIEETRHEVTIHFLGWDKLYDVVLPRRGDRIAEFDTKTEGRDTRKQVGADRSFAVSDEVLTPYETKIDEILSGAASESEALLFVRRDLSDFVAQTLSSRIPAGLFDRVNRGFVHRVIRLCCFYLATCEGETKVPPAIMVQLNRVFLGDERCNDFFEDAGQGVRGDVPEGDEFMGFAARLPPGGASKLVVENVNVFYAYGGHELLIRRIDDPVNLIPLPDLKLICQSVFHSLWRVFSPPFVQHVWPRVVRAVFNRLKRMTEKELRANDYPSLVKRGEIGFFIMASQVWLTQPDIVCREARADRPLPHEDSLEETIDVMLSKLEMFIASRQTRVPSLPLRLKGLNHVKESVETACESEGVNLGDAGVEEDEYGYSMYGNQRRPRGKWDPHLRKYVVPKPNHFTGEVLADYIVQTNLVDAVLGRVAENEDGDLAELIEPASVESVPLASLRPIAGDAFHDFTMRGIMPYDAKLEGICVDRPRVLAEAATLAGLGSKGVAASGAGRQESSSAAAAASASASASAASALEGVSSQEPPPKRKAPPLGPHEKLIPPLTTILLFLAKYNRLERSHLDALWATNPGARDESLRRAVFDAVSKLATLLDADLLSLLYERIAATPLDHLDDATMSLIKSFTLAVLDTVDEAELEASIASKGRAATAEALEAQLHAFPLYWRIIVEAEKVDKDIVAMAMKDLVESFQASSTAARLLLMLNLRRCVSHIADGTAAARASELAQNVLSRIPVAPTEAAGDWTRGTVIQSLQEDYDVVGLLITSLETLRAQALKSAASLGLEPSYLVEDDRPRPLEGKVMAGSELYSAGVQGRLAFVGFLLKESAHTSLGWERFSKLWELFVSKFLTSADRSGFFDWLKETQFGTDAALAGVLSDEEVTKVFNTMLCQDSVMRFSAMTMSDLNCFMAFFVHVNSQAGNLSASATALDAMRTCKLDMIGLPAVWSILQSATRDPVWRAAADFLVQLYIKLHPTKGPLGEEAWESFLHGSMDNARELIQELK